MLWSQYGTLHKEGGYAEATATEFLFHLGEESKLVSKGVEVD